MVDQQRRSPALKSAASHTINTASSDDQIPRSRNTAQTSAAQATERSSSAPRAVAHKSTPSSSNDAALAAALSAGRASRSSAAAHDSPSTTPSDVARTQAFQQTMNGRQQVEARSNTLAAPLSDHNVPRVKSPSHAAALAAAARANNAGAGQHGSNNSTPLKRQSTQPVAKSQNRPAVAAKPRRLSVQSRPRSTSTLDSPTDTTSIAPTTSLVSLFEQKSSTPVAKGAPRPLVITPTNSIPLASPKPLRSSDGFRTILQNEMGSAERVQDLPHLPHEEKPRQEDVVLVAPKQADGRDPRDREDRPSPHNRSSNDSPRDRFSASRSADNDAGYGSTRAAQGDSLRKVGTAIDAQGRGGQGRQGSLIRAAAQESINPPHPTLEAGPVAAITASGATATPPTTTVQRKPALPPRSSTAKLPRTDSLPKPALPPRTLPPPISRPSTAPIDIHDVTNDRKLSHDTLSTSAQSNLSVNASYRHLYPKQSTSLTNDDDLANAIVASSLASSRLGSPQHRDVPPLPPSRAHSRHGRSLFHSRTPSPAKGGGLRQTLRKQDSSSSDDEDNTHPYGKHHKKRLIRKHPNKHHEGDRKRWRDAVTEGERKRYEGVWAANKGLHMPPPPKDPAIRIDPSTLSDQVSNIVTKDIWSRSRLPDFELEAVWDLVDSEGVGRLSKEEFVVGLWLIDQRLKGRKLPVKVTPTVWTSVRALHGIKVRK